MLDEINITPCPTCGGSAAFESDGEQVWVKCEVCGLSGMKFNKSSDEYDPYTEAHDSWEETVKQKTPSSTSSIRGC